MQKINNQGVD